MTVPEAVSNCQAPTVWPLGPGVKAASADPKPRGGTAHSYLSLNYAPIVSVQVHESTGTEKDEMNMRRPGSPLQEIHVAVLGMNGSGKSALTVKYITKRFITEYDPAIEDTYCKHELIRGQEYMVWIMDTVAGEGKDNSRYLGWADLFLVTYSITNLQSFEFARKILEEIASHDHSFCIRQHSTLLLGNKTDLERYRQVSKAQGTGLGTEFGAEFFEINTTEEYSLVRNVFHHGINSVIAERIAFAASAKFRSPSPPPQKGNNTSDSDEPSTASYSAGNRSSSGPKTSTPVGSSWRSKSPSAKLQESIKSNSNTLPPRFLPPSPALQTSTVPPSNKKGLKLFKLFNN